MKYVGHKQSFIDAREKVTGRAKYLDDLSFPGMLHAKILRSPHPHARILRIDTAEAAALPGVYAVITAADCPDNRFGLDVADVTMLAIEKVRYVGDEIAAVAAESEEIAQEAVNRIHVEYELLPVVDDMRKAMEPGAPLVHEDKPGNIAKEYHFQRGDVDADFAQCDYVFEQDFSTHRVNGLPMEPMGAIALWESNGRLVMHTCIQAAFQARNELAKALGLDVSQVEVKVPFVGGGFGAKIWIRNFHPITAVLAKKTGRPVKYILTRQEDLITSRPRVAPQIHLKMGFMKDGTMVAKQAYILGDNGAYTWAAAKILNNMSIRTDCLYRFRSTKTDSYLVYTNLLPTSGFRGYGNSQAHYALECFVDECCKEMGLDPVAVRLKNCSRQGDLTIHGWKLKSCALDQCIEIADREIKKGRLPKSADGGAIRRGVATCAMVHVSGNRGGNKFDGSAAVIRVHEDGRVFLFSGEANLGQGANTVFAQIAAEELGVDIDAVTVMPLDTDTCPFGMGTYSSRVTTLGGSAVKHCAEQVRRQVLEVAGAMLGLHTNMLELRDGKIVYTSDESKFVTFRQAANEAIRTNKGVPLSAHYVHEPATVGADASGYGDYSSGYSFGAQGVEVEVDTRTGVVKVLRVTAAHDVGRAINPNGVIGQINGGVAQGIGWTLYENQLFDKGKPLMDGLHKYTVMTSKDMPEIKSFIVESNNPGGPYGAKGVGEPTLIPTAPAICNAIEDACGVKIRDLPVTPEKIYWALHPKTEKEGLE